jgi:purine catabolism regulator
LSHHFIEANLHFMEAEQVLSFSSEITSPFFDDLGVYRILTQIKNDYILSSFITDYLGQLIEYDDKHNSQLLLTLNVLFQCNGSKKEAADRLFIRRQTLYHRLDKIERILGNTYLTPNHRLCLELALRAHEWSYQKNKQTTLI